MAIESMAMGDAGTTAIVMVGWVVVDGGKVDYLFLRRATYCWDFLCGTRTDLLIKLLTRHETP